MYTSDFVSWYAWDADKSSSKEAVFIADSGMIERRSGEMYEHTVQCAAKIHAKTLWAKGVEREITYRIGVALVDMSQDHLLRTWVVTVRVTSKPVADASSENVSPTRDLSTLPTKNTP